MQNRLNLHSVKDGSGRELHRLHKVAQPNLRAISSMGMEDYCAFITALLELKLDADMMFLWQNESELHVERTPPFGEFLRFIDGRAQVAGNSSTSKRVLSLSVPPGKKQGNHGVKPVSYLLSAPRRTLHKNVSCVHLKPTHFTQVQKSVTG